ncbi:hypothetical protein REPUB_Repub19eG0079400 [Reevesia pubescens]
MVLGPVIEDVGEDIKDGISLDLDVLELNTDDAVNHKIKNCSLVGKVLADKLMKICLLRTILMKAWPVNRSLKVHGLDRNIFLFAFKDEKNKKKAILQSPWSVMNSIVILKEWPVEATLGELDFSTSDFWVHVHNLPLAYLTKPNAMKIASVFENVVEIDWEGDKDIMWSGYLRMKVTVRVDDPLKIGFNLRRKNSKPIGVSFKYERLSDFCYHFGRLGHGARDCCYRLDGTEKSIFGLWLRASYQGTKNNTKTENNKGSSRGKMKLVEEDEDDVDHAHRRSVKLGEVGRQDINPCGHLLAAQETVASSLLKGNSDRQALAFDNESETPVNRLIEGNITGLKTTADSGPFGLDSKDLNEGRSGSKNKRARPEESWVIEKKLKMADRAQVLEWVYKTQPGM